MEGRLLEARVTASPPRLGFDVETLRCRLEITEEGRAEPAFQMCAGLGDVLDAIPVAVEKAAEKETDAKAPPPLIILLSIDTLRRDHLEAYGYRRQTSPFMASELARRGAIFDNLVEKARAARG